MSTTAIPLDELVTYRRQSRLLDEWTDLQTLRSVHDALERHLDQAGIARVLGISQPAVSKIAKRVRLSPEVLHRSPREVIIERALGKIGDEDLLNELCTWPFTDGRFGDEASAEPEAYQTGTFDQVTDAVGDGLLRPDEYQAIVRARAR